jgi:hypothetical protein
LSSPALVGAEECLLAMPAAHPLAARDAVAPHVLAAHTVVMFPRDRTPAVWDFLAGALGVAAAPGRLHVLPVNGQEAMVQTALALGAVCPVSAGLAGRLAADHANLVLRPLDPPVRAALHLAWRHPPPAAVHALAETASGRASRPGTNDRVVGLQVGGRRRCVDEPQEAAVPSVRGSGSTKVTYWTGSGRPARRTGAGAPNVNVLVCGPLSRRG